MSRIKHYLALFFVAIFGFTIVLSSNAGAINVFDTSACNGASNTAVCKAKGDDASKMIQVVVDTMMFILGAIAVIMIIVGGIRYTTSNGDSSNVKSAKDTILYSVIGLVVALLAYAVVNWVVDRFV